MTRHFHRDLQNLHEQILSLSAEVEEMIDSAGRALCARDHQEIAALADADCQVDDHEVSIEEECLKMLALHQPVAVDLRRIATVMKINNDLERVGDLAVNISERAKELHECPNFPLPPKIEQMVIIALEMVRGALNAFVEFDATAGYEICRRDDEVDQLNREVIQELIELMQQRPDLIKPAMHCFSAARHFERIADHATNIAEDVIYLVCGEIVRHHMKDQHVHHI